VPTLSSGHSPLTSDPVIKRRGRDSEREREPRDDSRLSADSPSIIQDTNSREYFSQPQLTITVRPLSQSRSHSPELDTNIETQLKSLQRPISLSRTSSQNPFFGYRFSPWSHSPFTTVSDSTIPGPSHQLTRSGNIYTNLSFLDSHGNPTRQRRLTDLLYTLLRMYYRRWRVKFSILLVSIFCWFLARRFRWNKVKRK
jgi:hypothetical protein